MESKFIPILYSTPMVQAIQEDRKTKTRRTKGLEEVNISPNDWILDGIQIMDSFIFHNKQNGEEFWTKCPYGNVGDILWVRENYLKPPDVITEKMLIDGSDTWPSFDYQADCELGDIAQYKEWGWKIKPSIHMPKVAARIFLQIKSVTVERLNDITPEDAIAEGIKMTWISDNPKLCMFKNYIQDGRGSLYPKDSFHSLWLSINGPTSWVKNPFVWVIEFEKVEKPENFV